MNVSPSLKNLDLFCELKKLRFVKKNHICLYVDEKIWICKEKSDLFLCR